ncbi:hypothetical protein K440DRAFT_643448 [Wilcoxina mikolae CBS 423.85]|nr:hypothetical protein K440DRAFT_643448 [Wilcoxina mikolae CBS 423.85]
MLRSILYGLLNQDESLFICFQREYRQYCTWLLERGHGDFGKWPYESLMRLFLSIGDCPRVEYGQLCLIIDAVYEFDDRGRHDIFRLLFELCSRSKFIIKVFIASRPVSELEHYLVNFHQVIRMQDVNRPDIRSFVDSFLPELDFPGDVQIQIAHCIIEHAHGVFLWVPLVRDKLVEYDLMGYAKRMIFDMLRGLPTDLEGLYEVVFRDFT